MQPHNGQISRENATSSSGTYPLAHYKEVPPPRTDILRFNDFPCLLVTFLKFSTHWTVGHSSRDQNKNKQPVTPRIVNMVVLTNALCLWPNLFSAQSVSFMEISKNLYLAVRYFFLQYAISEMEYMRS